MWKYGGTEPAEGAGALGIEVGAYMDSAEPGRDHPHFVLLIEDEFSHEYGGTEPEERLQADCATRAVLHHSWFVLLVDGEFSPEAGGFCIPMMVWLRVCVWFGARNN